MAYREFDQPEVPKPQRADYGAITRVLGGVDPFNRELFNSEAMAGRNKKKPTFKVDPKEAPFSKDQELIGSSAAMAYQKAMAGVDPSMNQASMEQVSALSKAHEKEINTYGKQINDLQQAYGNAIDPTPVHREIAKASNEDDVFSRPETLKRASSHITDPSSGLFNSEKHTANLFNALPEQKFNYKETNENGDVTTFTDRQLAGKLLVDDPSKPQFRWENGKKIPVTDDNGNPVFQKKSASTIKEALPVVDRFFDSDRNYADWTTAQVLRKEKKSVDDLIAKWVDSERNRPDGGVPSKETIEAKRWQVANSLAKEKVAKQLLQMDRPVTTYDNSRTLDEPPQPRSGSLPTYKVSPIGTSNAQVKMRMRGNELGERTYHTSGKPVAIIGEKGEQLQVDANNIDGINEETGKRFVTTQSVDGRLSEIVPAFGIRYTNKQGQTTTNPSDIGVDQAKSLHEGILSGWTVDRIQKELERHPDAKFEFYPSATVALKPRKNDYSELSPEQVAKVERYKELKLIKRPSKEQRKEIASLATDYEEYTDQNISTDANNIAQVNRFAKQNGFRTTMDLALSQHSREEREAVARTQAEINRRVQQAKANIANGQAPKQGKEVERKTSDGKIAIFDSDTKQFLRYK